MRSHSLVACLLLFLAAVGAFDGISGLLMIAPFLLLIGFLLAGHYPGERVIAVARRALSSRRLRPKPALLPLVETRFNSASRILAGRPGPRGPPLAA